VKGKPSAARENRPPPSEAHRHPHPPALRASPYPEVTGRSCRLPSPARDRSSRGGAPREPDAVVGTVRTGGDVLPLRVFMDRRRKPDTPRGGVSCRPAHPPSPDDPAPEVGHGSLERRENPPGPRRRRPRRWFASPRTWEILIGFFPRVNEEKKKPNKEETPRSDAPILAPEFKPDSLSPAPPRRENRSDEPFNSHPRFSSGKRCAKSDGAHPAA
jgi:hypothetical protein